MRLKAPKIYFYDTGLVCSLLNIQSAEDLSLSTIRGALFESYIMSEIYKYNYNRVRRPEVYFWRDVQGHEIDCIIEKSIESIIPVEIKAQKTMNESFFKGLLDWNTITGLHNNSYIVYTGDEVVQSKKGYVYTWKKLIELLDSI